MCSLVMEDEDSIPHRQLAPSGDSFTVLIMLKYLFNSHSVKLW